LLDLIASDPNLKRDNGFLYYAKRRETKEIPELYKGNKPAM